jgi:hypothetical protein
MMHPKRIRALPLRNQSRSLSLMLVQKVKIGTKMWYWRASRRSCDGWIKDALPADDG